MESHNFLDFSGALHQPFFDKLGDCKNILIAGCGGGYDFFSGIPLYYALQKGGANCHLANLTFSSTDDIGEVEKINEVCFKVTTKSKRLNKTWSIEKEVYWPELQVSHWFQKNEGKDVPVYQLLSSGGVVKLKAAYEALVKLLNLDAIILADGGTDSLMFGDESGLGTPNEDMMSIASVNAVSVRKKFLINLGFGIDSFHGVCHSHYLENLAKITQAGGFLGTFSLHPSMEEAKKFEEIYVSCNPGNSIVCSSILSSLQGNFGNYHSQYTKSRTGGSPLYISHLMSLYFTFDLNVVAKHILYLDHLLTTKTYSETRNAIHQYCSEHGYYNNRKYTGDRKDVRIPY
eukprot:TRINITY_DN23499_c0_g1_i1.p1 TRINITY_DN23499_c0_g1~~TRINITY_DN23499_c0_g1_i1.p1  ORF type:complete len:345 (+),score=62.84 TRINITY_DN23499_c0_g1_i1:59-1093(+)